VSATIAVLFGVPPGRGGLGVQVANALAALASGDAVVHAIGPTPAAPIAAQLGPRVVWHAPPEWLRPAVLGGRWRTGALQYARDTAMGAFAQETVAALRPSLCYAFTQVALETLAWARANGVTTVLESPNGHIANFRRVYEEEARRWCHGIYPGHPTRLMVARVEEEYALAGRIRVSSDWSRQSFVAGGVAADRLTVLPQAVDTGRFQPGLKPGPAGPLRACFVGLLDLRKGFVYLLEALRMLPDRVVSLDIVGATGDWCCRRLFERSAEHLDVRCVPGDPVPVLQRAELFVFPTLEDGSPFAVAEAMASGLPVITTRDNGSAEWVRPETGWIVPPRDSEALKTALETAIARRHRLAEMGLTARADTLARTTANRQAAIFEWAMAPLAAA
jgi:glycosyltransferase involved in cell wall biosynthesis